MIIIVTFKLMKDDKCILYLTERTIKHIKFISPKVKDMLRQLTRDIELTIKVDNSDLDELFSEKKDDSDEALPREIDSVRDLLVYAVFPANGQYSYLDGELEIVDGYTKSVSKYSYKDLFVMKFEESFKKDARDTHMFITLREWER